MLLIRWTGWPGQSVLSDSCSLTSEAHFVNRSEIFPWGQISLCCSWYLILTAWSWEVASKDASWTPGLNFSADSRGVLSKEGRLLLGQLGRGRLENGLRLEFKWVWIGKSPTSRTRVNKAGSYSPPRRGPRNRGQFFLSTLTNEMENREFFRHHLRENDQKGFPGGLAIKDTTFSLLWDRFYPWPGNFYMP